MSPPGLILDQSLAPQTQVSSGTAVDIAVSSGPALQVELASLFVSAGSALPVSITVYGDDGAALDPQPVPTLSLEFDATEVTGALPVVSETSIATGASTRGAFTLRVDAAGFGTQSVDFLVRGGLAGDAFYSPIMGLLDAIDEAGDIHAAIIGALQSGNLPQAAILAQQLVALRASVDPDALSQRNPFAPETGYLPTYSDAVASGFSASFGELGQMPFHIGNVRDALLQSRAFLDTVNPQSARNDDVRARALNEQLEAAVDGFNTIDLGTGALVFFNADNFELFTRRVPELFIADLDASIRILTDQGLLAMTPTETSTLLAQTSPNAFYAHTRPSAFTLIGMMSASAIRSNLITKLYVPYIKRVTAAGLLLANADALVGNPQAVPLTGIITGASLSFHSFRTGNSIVEGPFLSTRAASFAVGVIGPDIYLNVIDDVLALSGDGGAAGFLGRLVNLKDTIKALGGALELSRTEEVVRGCVLDQNPDCKEILIRDGFKVVHSGGGFPAPVLVIVTDLANYRTYFGVYPFFPN